MGVPGPLLTWLLHPYVTSELRCAGINPAGFQCQTETSEVTIFLDRGATVLLALIGLLNSSHASQSTIIFMLSVLFLENAGGSALRLLHCRVTLLNHTVNTSCGSKFLDPVCGFPAFSLAILQDEKEN